MILREMRREENHRTHRWEQEVELAQMAEKEDHCEVVVAYQSDRHDNDATQAKTTKTPEDWRSCPT
jgi:hypothetical protein